VLAEEHGFDGFGAILLLYGVYYGSATADPLRAQDRAGILLVVSVVAMGAFHVVYNSALVVGLVPITGIPLPFLAYGGSFTVVNWVIVGLVLNVDFRPEIYSPLGYDWVQENGMTSIILRHHPELSAVLPRSESAFAPWRATRSVL